MATKKSKSSNKSTKTQSTKSKTAEKSAKKTAIKAADTNTTKNTEAPKAPASRAQKSSVKDFFARKYTEKESIFTVFKNPKFYGALLSEAIGTMLIALLLLSLALIGVTNIATYAFALIAVLIAVYAFSGACLNPIVAIGMMATRRISAIRGIMYVVAEIFGAWLGWLILSAFHLVGGETAYDLPVMSDVPDGGMWMVAFVELFGAAIIGFFFARALAYKRSVFTFAAVASGGVILAILAGYIVSAAFLQLNNNFIFNPSVALMMDILPTAGDSFGEVLGGICQALTIYAIFPMLGGVIGFYLSDATAALAGEE